MPPSSRSATGWLPERESTAIVYETGKCGKCKEASKSEVKPSGVVSAAGRIGRERSGRAPFYKVAGCGKKSSLLATAIPLEDAAGSPRFRTQVRAGP